MPFPMTWAWRAITARIVASLALEGVVGAEVYVAGVRVTDEEKFCRCCCC